MYFKILALTCLVGGTFVLVYLSYGGSFIGEAHQTTEKWTRWRKISTQAPKNGTENQATPKIWASLGLCWGENFQNYGKQDFPYARAAVYATKLWKSQSYNQIDVVITIVLAPGHDEGQELGAYIRELRDAGATVVTQPTLWSNCVQQSQVVRMYSFLHPFIAEDDIIITADVDTFIIGDSVMKMLSVASTVWVGEFVHTASTGGSIPMALVAMTARQWKQSLDFSQPLGIKADMAETVKAFEKKDGGQN